MGVGERLAKMIRVLSLPLNIQKIFKELDKSLFVWYKLFNNEVKKAM
jgi:hypothetical protein